MRDFINIVQGNVVTLTELQGIKSARDVGVKRSISRTDFFYFMADQGFELIGYGDFGAVFDADQFGGRYVFKVFHDPAYRSFVEYCMKNSGNPHLPVFHRKIIDLAPRISGVRIERLDKVYFNGYKNRIWPAVAEVTGQELEPELVNKFDQGLYDTLLDISKHVPSGSKLDLHHGNFMRRGNVAVVTDPFASTKHEDLPFST